MDKLENREPEGANVIQSEPKVLRMGRGGGWGDSRWCKFQSESKNPRSGVPMSKGRRWVSQLKQEQVNSPFLYLFVLLSPSMDWMVLTHLGKGWSSLLSLLIQMVISSGDTLTNTLRNNVLPAIGASLSPVKLTCKINHHKHKFPSTCECINKLWYSSTMECYSAIKRNKLLIQTTTCMNLNYAE